MLARAGAELAYVSLKCRGDPVVAQVEGQERAARSAKPQHLAGAKLALGAANRLEEDGAGENRRHGAHEWTVRVLIVLDPIELKVARFDLLPSWGLSRGRQR